MPAKVIEKKDNVFPKELKDALLNYSNAYDDYCLAEQEYNETLPPSKRKSFKASSQRLKTFDDMLAELDEEDEIHEEMGYEEKLPML